MDHPDKLPTTTMQHILASDFVFDFTRAPLAMLATAVVLFLFIITILAPLVAPTNPFDPASLNLMNGFTPPMTPNMFTGQSFVMGTDDQGRDLLSAIIFGLRVSLFVGVMSVLLAMGIGVSLGLVAGYVGGWLENLTLGPVRARGLDPQKARELGEYYLERVKICLLYTSPSPRDS